VFPKLEAGRSAQFGSRARTVRATAVALSTLP